MRLKYILLALLCVCLWAPNVRADDSEIAVRQNLKPLLERVVRIAHGSVPEVELEDDDYLFHGVILNDRMVLTTSHKTEGIFSFWVERKSARSIFKSASYDYMVISINSGYGLGTLKITDQVDLNDRLYMPDRQRGRWIWAGPGRIIKIEPERLLTAGLYVQEGDSGKPVFNDRGELVGLVMSVVKEFTYLFPARIIKEQLKIYDFEIEPFFFK